MDAIIIKNLRIKTIIGVLAEEKLQPQLLILDLKIKKNLALAAKSDHLKDTIDYSAMVHCIDRFAQEHHFELLEAFASKLLDELMTKFELAYIKILVKKPNAIANANYAAVCMQRIKPTKERAIGT